MKKGIFWLLLLIGACTKVAPVRSLTPPNNNPDTARDVVKVLDSLPGFSLFALAAQRGGVDTLLDPGTFYTLFVPTDSAMQAAGLTAQAIAALPTDSLGKWVQYHIVFGNTSAAALTNAPVSVQLFGIRQDYLYTSSNHTYNVFQYSLFVKENGVLYINGVASNSGEAVIQAGNGYLYPINRVLQAPTQTVYGLIGSRPELSMYYFAINVIDSVTEAFLGGQVPSYLDSVVFSQLQYVKQAGSQNSNPIAVQPTVFAPTNTAFQQAGFASTDDIRNYVLSAPPANVIINNNSETAYDGLDTVLKSHYLYNPAQGSNGAAFAPQLCYNDLIGYPGINNNVLNICYPYYPFQMTTIVTFPLQFSNTGGVLNIQWNPNLPPAQLPYDTSRSLQAMNGMIYETDKLFYPHN
jgi:uncharacterized surface protein with fasciclin (FAS1) repeats